MRRWEREMAAKKAEEPTGSAMAAAGFVTGDGAEAAVPQRVAPDAKDKDKKNVSASVERIEKLEDYVAGLARRINALESKQARAPVAAEPPVTAQRGGSYGNR